MKIELLQANIPSKSGIIYTIENLEAIVQDFRKTTARGPMLGDLKSGLDFVNGQLDFKIYINEASHIVENVTIEDDILYADIKLLNNSAGMMLYTLFNDKMIKFYPLVVGKQISPTEIDSSTLELLTVRIMTLPKFAEDDDIN